MVEGNNKTKEVADRVLITLFALVLSVTGAWQLYYAAQGDRSDKKRFENQVESESLAAMKAKSMVQLTKASMGWLSDGVVVDNGISYLVEDLQHGSRRGDYVNGEGNAYDAIVDLRDQLAKRNIQLIVMIVDGKGVTKHSGTQRMLTVLEEQGVNVVHVCGESVDQYLKHDSHWRPEMMERQAQRLGRMIVEKCVGFVKGNGVYTESVSEVINEGDLVRARFSTQSVETVNVKAVERSKDSVDVAKVLLLGDSYSNIFSAPEMGWGEKADLGERLSFHLQNPCKVVAVNGNGAHASRRELARSPELLEGKQVVVWQFAARELDRDQWEKVVIPDAKGKLAQSHLTTTGYEEYEVLSLPVWKKDSVYPTSLTEVLLMRKGDGKEVLVRMLLKKNRRFTLVEKLKEGEEVQLKISDFKKQKRFQRSELFSLDRYDLEVYWGELK